MTSRVDGLNRTQAALRRMGPETAKQIEVALEAGAQEIADRARSIAPRDTGEMVGAIEVRKTLEGFNGTGAVGNFARMVSGAANGMTRFIGVFPDSRSSPGWYAAWVEFGTTTRAGKPFLQPSFFSLRKRVQGRIGRAVNKAVREVAARGGSGS
jgi:HK97 gp10 family phage protein